MSANSKIEWTDHTANLWWGCVEVSPLCDHCYAREWAKRYDRAKWGADEPRLTIKSVWNDLKRFQRDAAEAGRIDRVFVGSMMDIFEKPMPVVNAKGELVEGITTGDLRTGFQRETVPAYPNLLFLLLTKRPQNVVKYVPPEWLTNPPANVMVGTSVGTRDGLKAIDHLRQWPGRRFLSIEPLLEDLGEIDMTGIHWVIVGGESGSKARAMNPNWARSIRDQCRAADIPFLFKQWGEWMPTDDPWSEGVGDPDHWLYWDNDESRFVSGFSRGQQHMVRVGKHAAGRTLDGRTWDDLPIFQPLTGADYAAHQPQ